LNPQGHSKDPKETHNKIKRVFIQNLVQNIPKRNSKENSSNSLQESPGEKQKNH
jgi:hypothetical protein